MPTQPRRPAKKSASKKKPDTVVPQTAKEMLHLLDRFFLRRDSEGTILWNVLSALRGPDSCNTAVKTATTNVIRQAAFPVSSKNRNTLSPIPADVGKDALGLVLVRQNGNRLEELTSHHFHFHVQEAFRALKLSWRDKNPERE